MCESPASSVSSVSSVADVSSPDVTEDESEENARRRLPRIFRNHIHPFDIYGEEDFKKRFRLTKQCVLNVLEQIEEDIKPLTLRNYSIPALNQLLITLRFYASGSFQVMIADQFNVSKCTVGRIVHRVTHFIALLREKYIKMPSTPEERRTVCEDFFKISGFPNVCGAIDGTHIKMQSPGRANAEVFRNRKGFFSINIQAVCDANLRINDIVARWPGSTHDSRIFDNSLLRAKFENNQFANGFLLGDSGYPCRRYILTPLLNANTPAEIRYNRAHIKTRNTIERCFGVLWRFPCLSRGLRLSLNKSVAVIVAVCVLHNICINMNDEENNYQEVPEEDIGMQDIFVNHLQENNAVRTAIINEIFA